MIAKNTTLPEVSTVCRPSHNYTKVSWTSMGMSHTVPLSWTSHHQEILVSYQQILHNFLRKERTTQVVIRFED